MVIKNTSTESYDETLVQTKQAVEVQTTHLVVNFIHDAAYIRQVFVDADDKIVKRRYLKVTGTKYNNFADNIMTKLSQLASNIEANNGIIDGVEVQKISRDEFMNITMRR